MNKNQNSTFSLDKDVVDKIQVGAESRNMSKSSFLSECVESYTSRNLVLDEIVKATKQANGAPEWKCIEQLAIITAARNMAERSVCTSGIETPPQGDFNEIFEFYKRQFTRQAAQYEMRISWRLQHLVSLGTISQQENEAVNIKMITKKLVDNGISLDIVTDEQIVWAVKKIIEDKDPLISIG
jgi:hypothetical protein